VNVSNNGRSGVSAGTAHLVLNGGDGTPGTANVISHNGGVGVAIFNTGEADINGDNQITFNGGPFGLELSIPVQCSCLMESSTATPASVFIAVRAATASGQALRRSTATRVAESKITDHSDGYIDGGITISGNTGVGILVDLSSLLNSLGGNTISNNTGDAVVLNTLSVLKFALPDTITATTGNLALTAQRFSCLAISAL